MKKRIVSLLMALALCLSLLPTAAFAQQGEPAEQPVEQEQLEPAEPAEPTPAEPEEGAPVEDAEEEEKEELPEEQQEQQDEQDEQPEPAMLASANGIAVLAVWKTGHTHYLCGGSACNGSGHENESSMTTFEKEIKQVGSALYIGNTEWPVSAYGSYALDGGVYYLSTNLTPDHMIQCNGNVTLCLNGHSITANHDGDVIAVNSGVTFTLTDCKGGNSDAAFGKITHASGKNGSGVYVDSATFNMYGGSITDSMVSSSSSSGGGVYVTGNGTFHMYGGSITNNKAGSLGVGGGVYVTGNGTFHMSSGSITGNTANVGGGVYVDGGSFKMSGGTISSNTARSGGGVYVYSRCTFEMSSGTISSNTATGKGGGVYVEGGTFEMTGGSIGGTETGEANTAGTSGGGVYVNDYGTFKMNGGSITGNSATGSGGGVYVDGNFTMSGTASSITGNNATGYGGGVYVMNGTFTVSGNVNVTGNTTGATKVADGKFTGGTNNNVYLKTTEYSKKTITVGGALTDGAQLGVTLSEVHGDNPFTSGWGANMGDKSPSDYFISDIGGKGFELSGGEVKLCDGHTHYLCGGSTCNSSGHQQEAGKTTFEKEIRQVGSALYIDNTEWLAGDRYALSTGSYCLSTDLTLDAGIKITGNVTLCLNGHSITANHDGDVIAVNSGATFTLTDCKGGNSDAAFGKITHASGKDGRGVYVEGRSATFNMYGGSIAGNNMFTDDYVGNDEVGGGVYIAGDGATFNMYGGTICGNTAGSSGGGVYMVEKTNFNMYGGTICGNTATRNFGGGVCVYKNGNFNMSGGEIGDNGARCGGGVFVGDDSTFTMTGGSITGNNVSGRRAGGGIYISDSAKKFTVSGNIQITGNTKTGTRNENGKYTGGKVENLYLLTGVTVTVGGTLTEGAKLGVTLDSNYGDNAFTSGWSDKMSGKVPADYFSSDVDGYEAKLYDTELKLVSTHVHSWTYTAEGATITAKCGDNSCTSRNGGSITINKPSNLTYDGSVKEATVEKSNWQGGNVTITYSPSAPKDAGTYTASIRLGSAAASVTYTITKADPQASDFTFTAPSDLTYDGNAKTASVNSSKNGMGDVTLKYYKGDSLLSTALTDAGEYTVKIDVAAGTNYNAASDLTADGWKFTIAKADYTGTKEASANAVISQTGADVYVTLPELPEGASYGTASMDNTSTDKDGNQQANIFGSGSVTIENDTLKLNVQSGTVGLTAHVKVAVTGATNYQDYVIDITVTTVAKTPANVTVTGLPAKVTYGDAGFILNASVTDKGEGTGVWTWSSSDESVLKITGNGASAKVEVVGIGNAAITAAYESETTSGTGTTAEIAVSPRTITVTADNKTMTVNGKLPEFTVSYGNLPAGVKAEDIFGTLPTASTTADGKTVGGFEIAVTEGSLKDACKNNYTVEIASGKLTVTKQSGGYYYYTPAAGGTTDANKSPRTGDAGLLVYGLTALSSYTGTALVLRRKRED